MRNWVAERCDPYREEIPEIPREVVLTAAQLYIEAFETITGAPFVAAPPDRPVLERIRASLARYFP